MRAKIFTTLIALFIIYSIMPQSVARAQETRLFDEAIDQLLRRDETLDSQSNSMQIPQSKVEVELSFAPLVRKVSGSVVNVYAARRSVRTSPFSGDPFFERFFGGRGFNRPRNQNSLGSGVVVSPNGVIVTNHHVIKDADDIKIALADGQEFEARVLLKDEESDLAVLKVNGLHEFQALEIGDSENAQVGDLVLAIGNPYGVGQTVTSGIISAVARSSRGVSDFGFFLQTDAAINPGNSGGALIDMNGLLIGINTAIYSRSGGSNGIGFAIPSNMVRVAITSAETGNILKRPWIGASFQKVTPDIAQSLGMESPRGALVVGVVENSPSDLAGIKAGDVLLGINGNPVPHINALGYRLTTVGIGNFAEILVLSHGELVRKNIELIAAPETVPANETAMPGRSALGGAMIANLSPALAQRVKLPSDKSGVVVLEVVQGSLAAANGLRPGDILREINYNPVNSVSEVKALINRKGRRWIFVVERGGREYVFERNGGFFQQYSR